MARKQVGMVDAALLARVDAAAAVLGQSRVVFVERALVAALEPVCAVPAVPRVVVSPAAVAQVGERDLAKVEAAGSMPAGRLELLAAAKQRSVSRSM